MVIGNTAPASYRVHGLDCAEEVAVLKREVGPVVGGEDRLGFDILNGRMTVAAEATGSPNEVQAAVARTGMRAEPWTDAKGAATDADWWERNRRTVLTAASGVLLLAGVATHAALAGFRAAFFDESSGWPPAVAVACYALSVLAGVWTVLPKAWIAARRLRPDMNLLMVVAVCGAIGIGQWVEAATVACLFSLSLALEAWSVGRARRAVAALMALTPPSARLLHPDGREEEVPPDRVPVGGRFCVRPGDRVPLDGRVVEGAGGVDQAPITGESVPVEVAFNPAQGAGTLHFRRGTARERHQQNTAGIGAADDQMRHAMRQRVGLAGARARDHQQGPGIVVRDAVLDRRTLVGIELVEIVHANHGWRAGAPPITFLVLFAMKPRASEYLARGMLDLCGSAIMQTGEGLFQRRVSP